MGNTDSQEHRQIAASLARPAGATAAQIADTTVETWREIDTALTSIIGQRGVAALYKRSLALTVPNHPWLADTLEGVQTALDLAALKSLLAQQSSAHAAAASCAVLQTFHDLLSRLVGPSLTERLLGSVWTPFLSGPTAQDISP